MTKTKTLILAATAALSLGAGAAMAQEMDAQFLRPSDIPTPTRQWLPGTNATTAGVPVSRTYSVQTGQYSADPGMAGGGDGSAH